jgi:hypothetical protein
MLESIELLSTGRTLASLHPFFLFAGFLFLQHISTSGMRRLVHRVLHWSRHHHRVGFAFGFFLRFSRFDSAVVVREKRKAS